MSRILNRPMFRGGGKVSSYGTGIASGLADGGRVDFKHGGTHASLTLPEQRSLIAYKKPGAQKYTDTFLEDRLNEYKKNLYTSNIPDLDIAYGMQMIPPMSDEQLAQANYFKETPEDFTKDFYSGEIGGTNYNKLQSDQLAAATLAGEQDLFKLLEKETVKNDTPEVKIETAPQIKKLTDEEKLAEVEKDQAFFEKLLGGGKEAKIQDASDMAISFASKALGEGATVKSAFADFLADETKRPSRRMKVKDAATQAAIQSYLTGKTSLQKFQDEIGVYGTKLDMAEAREKKNKTTDDLLAARAKELGENLTSEAVMSGVYNRIYGDDSFVGEMKPGIELIPGKIYYTIENNDRIIFQIDKKGDPKQVDKIFQ